MRTEAIRFADADGAAWLCAETVAQGKLHIWTPVKDASLQCHEDVTAANHPFVSNGIGVSDP